MKMCIRDRFKIDQDSYANRLKLCVPVLGVGAFLGIGNALGLSLIHIFRAEGVVHDLTIDKVAHDQDRQTE